MALVLAVALAACNEHRFVQPGPPILGPGGTLPEGTDVRLVVGQSTQVNDLLVLTFSGVPQDSRCPADAMCVWAGNAEVQLSASLGRGVAIPFTLNTTLPPRDTVFGPYRIALVDLSPVPLSGGPIGLDEYLVTLRVSILPD